MIGVQFYGTVPSVLLNSITVFVESRSVNKWISFLKDVRELYKRAFEEVL